MGLHVQIPDRGRWATALCTSDPRSANRFRSRLAEKGHQVRVVSAGQLCLESLTKTSRPVPAGATCPMAIAVNGAMDVLVKPKDSCLRIRDGNGRWIRVDEAV